MSDEPKPPARISPCPRCGNYVVFIQGILICFRCGWREPSALATTAQEIAKRAQYLDQMEDKSKDAEKRSRKW